MYRPVVVTTLLYGAESLVMYGRHLRLFECFHQRYLRSILNIHWSDFLKNLELLQRAEIATIDTSRSWMEDFRLPKIVLYNRLWMASSELEGMTANEVLRV